jgi:hypothetical protein
MSHALYVINIEYLKPVKKLMRGKYAWAQVVNPERFSKTH